MGKKTIPHTITGTPDDVGIQEIFIGTVHRASKKSIKTVLSAPEGDSDGRSEFVWVRLATGDLILGVFPKGDTYFKVEKDAQYMG